MQSIESSGDRGVVDVVVVGAGIMGASCAYQLATRGLRVAVIDALSGPGEGSTGRSFASVRSQWSDPLNIEISWRSIQQYRDFEKDYGISVGYRPSGYMFLVPDNLWDHQVEVVKLQREHGVPVEILTLDEAQNKTPFEVDGIGGVTWGPADGVVDPLGVTKAYLGLAREAGAVVCLKHKVVTVQRSGGRWHVETDRGSFESEYIVNAAGGWSGEVAALAGLDLPVSHSRRCIFSTGALRDFTPVPMTVDMGSGAYLRSEGDRVLFALGNAQEPAGLNLSVDWDWFETVMERLCERFPWLAELSMDDRGAWAGTYEVTPDHLPILGRSTQADGWLNACGFSGHGVMQAPMIGLLTAEELIHGRARTLNIDALRQSRFTSGSLSETRMVY